MSDRGNTTSDRTRAFPFLPASTECETGGLRFGLLGPLEVSDDTGPVAIGKPRQRAVLARLLLDVNHVVPIERVLMSRSPASLLLQRS